MNNSGLPNGAHADLQATPATETSALALIEEVKNRGRSSFARGNFPEAEYLYSRGIEVLTEKKMGGDAILYANRALARLNLGKLDLAVEDGESAIKVDPSYVKGYWRKGQALSALKNFQGAYEAFYVGSLMEPGNKALAKEMEKAKNSAEQAKLGGGADDDLPPPIKDVKTTVTKKEKKPTPTPKAKAAPAQPAPPTTNNTTEETDPDESGHTKSDHVRGYKTTSTGQKTSFFNNELTPEAKELIGDITPKQIDNASLAATPASLAGDANVSSWNSAGTWEEKVVTGWAEESLTLALKRTKYADGLNGGIEVSVVGVDNFAGEASVATVRGKRRFMYDFNFTIVWEAVVDGVQCKGALKFPDVAIDCDGVYESEYSCSKPQGSALSKEVKGSLERYVKKERVGLKGEIDKTITSWVNEFQAKYAK